MPNAIKIAKEMEQDGKRLFGIRLDSGDLSYLSKKARKMLDNANLNYVKIAASNQLDEHIIKSLLDQGAPIDAFGVGTSLVTGREDAALDGVYKLSEFDNTPRIKVSENIEKTVFPGKKKVLRILDENGKFYADALCLNHEAKVSKIFHPFQTEISSRVKNMNSEELLSMVIKNGDALQDSPGVSEIAAYKTKRLMLLPSEHLRFENPHVYKVGISKELLELRNKMIMDVRSKYQL